MKKSFLKELLLPSFLLLFFIVSPRNAYRDNLLKKADNREIKKQEAPGASNSLNKNKEATFTKALYSQF